MSAAKTDGKHKPSLERPGRRVNLKPAMILLVMSEMIPESRATERQRLGSAMAGVFGFLAMMVLQNVMVF